MKEVRRDPREPPRLSEEDLEVPLDIFMVRAGSHNLVVKEPKVKFQSAERIANLVSYSSSQSTGRSQPVPFSELIFHCDQLGDIFYEHYDPHSSACVIELFGNTRSKDEVFASRICHRRVLVLNVLISIECPTDQLNESRMLLGKVI